MSYTIDLLTGVARDLATLPGGGVYKSTDPYLPGEHAIVLHRLPIAPGHATAVSSYADEVLGTYRTAEETVRTFVQVTLRAASIDALHDLKDALQARYDRTKRTITADSGLTFPVSCRYLSTGIFDADDTGAPVATYNLAFIGTRKRV